MSEDDFVELSTVRKNSRTVEVKSLDELIAEAVLEENLTMYGTMKKTGEVLLGATNVNEWIDTVSAKDDWSSQANRLMVAYDFVSPSGFNFAEWAIENDGEWDHFLFTGEDHAVFKAGDVLLRISSRRRNINVSMAGNPESIKRYTKWFDNQWKRSTDMIRWVYSARGDEISVPLQVPAFHAEAYPWMQDPVGYMDQYLNSNANVLILIGPPGTGKTTFIKNLIARSNCGAMVAYDAEILSNDGFFASFIEGREGILVMEDADAFLSSRQEGNTMMHRFLNVSDGLVSASDKKIIFSTNLPNVNDIDDALMRPGRCFDVMQFRELQRDEAEVLARKVQQDLPDGGRFTLADVFNIKPSGNKPTRSVGFY